MNERELEELLRSRSEPLPPPPGRWEAVRRRARRRRVAKLSAAVLATVVVAAGIGLGPTVLFAHHHTSGSEQRISIAAPPSSPLQHAPTSAARAPETSASPVAGAGLTGFAPSSVSFVSQAEGYLLGDDGDGGSTVARTSDGGSSWSRLADLTIPAKTAGVRFATPDVGYVFGTKFFVTTTGGRAWQAEPRPGGFISDLETMSGHVYALVSSCARCRKVSLYGGSTASPSLQRVAGVPTMVGDSVSLAVYRDAAYVLDTVKGGPGQVWATSDGSAWSQRSSPCGTTMGLITEWSATGVAAACDVHLFAPGNESKRVYVSTNGAASWTALDKPPTRFGYINSVSASGPDDVVVADGQSGLDVTTDGGRHWTLRGPKLTDGAGFVGFISLSRVVALPAHGADRIFITSDDAGDSWSSVHFPR
ncbi:MAG TPA: hypothetical protein VHW92_02445 [Mycobacteriales bacterium]|nr:hypothetical protein [Mycobacteriales bacterium]